MKRYLALGLMVGCLIVAALLRIPELNTNPPGLHFDEAANGIISGDIGLRGERPIFITSYTGKEPLFFYLAGGLMNLIGESTFALRYTAVLIGILTIAAAYRLGFELLGNRSIGLFSAALLSVSLWHILFSRLGFRAISQPLLQALAIAALFYGLRRSSWLWIAAGGLAMGLTVYTYLAARIFPIPVALSLLPLLLYRRHRRLHLQQLATFFGIALIVALPLLVFFFNNPDVFWTRFDQVFDQYGQVASYFDSYLKTLGMFFILGDPYMRFNIPDRPIFNWFWGGMAVIGWLISLYRIVKEANPQRKAAYLLLVLIPLFLILPSSLAINEILPSNLRAIGLLPFIYILPAVGLFTLLTVFQAPANSLYKQIAGIAKRSPTMERLPEELSESWATRPPMLTFVLILILLIGGVSVSWGYFRQWSQRSDLYYENDADLVEVAQYLENLERNDAELFVASQHYQHPTMAFLSDIYDDLNWLPDSQALVIPADSEGLIVYTHNSPKPEWASALLSTDPSYIGPKGPDGLPTFEVYRVSKPISFPEDIVEVDVNFDGSITLLGYSFASGHSGQTMPTTLIWRVEVEPEVDLLPFVHLEDSWGHRWSQAEPFAYPSDQWSPGDLIIQRVGLPLPDGIPPGSYNLRVGIFEPESSNQLAVIDQAGRYAGSGLIVENVSVMAGDRPICPPEPSIVLNQAAGSSLKLIGFERESDVVASGAQLPLSLWWESYGPLNPHTIRLELLDENNHGLILSNTQPVHDTYPFSEWVDPQFIIDRQSVVIPSDTPEGDYQLNLRLLDGNDETLLTADLGPITVEQGQRIYAAPGTQFPQDAAFGSEIKLLGYNLVEDGSDVYQLELAWKALQDLSENYSVFVHLLDQDGTCCIWQDDSWPQQGAYPTDEWLEGEVVLDPYSIILPADLPPGTYPIEIGLYLPETGKRLQVEVPRLPTTDALILRSIEVE